VTDLTDLLIKLIPVFPLLAVIANGLFGSRYSHEVAHRLAWGSVGLSFLCTIGVFSDVLRTGTAHEVINGSSAVISPSISPIWSILSPAPCCSS
jgi:NADH-quinone oxidoreductase subunit L